MTIAPDKPELDVPPGHVKLTIDGIEVIAPKGELVIRACERLGIHVPRFCDHPLLEPAGACRQCLVEVEMGGKPMPKPQASCTLTVSDGMVVRTQHTSPVADKAQQGVMEMLLINHPLDCPICDKGGECPLQNQAMSNGRADSRFHETKRTFPKPIPITPQILLDRERCVLCQRCTRFADQIAGDQFIEMLERGAMQQIGTVETADVPGAIGPGPHCGGSYFSGNTIQICPVGALTSTAYRFRARPFDLMSTPGVCEHCASGCAQRTDWRRGKVMRRLAGNDPAVNEEWNCDKGRFAFTYATAPDRITRPLIRDAGTGELREASWTDALRVAAEGLLAARSAGGVGVLAGGRLTVEDAYAYAKFARVVLGGNDVDFRARPHSSEELDFLAAHVAGRRPAADSVGGGSVAGSAGGGPDNGAVTYADLRAAPVVLCVAFEPEEESPIVFLRLRKAARDGHTAVVHVSSWSSPGVIKTNGALLQCIPGSEAAVLANLPADVDASLREAGAVILVGERAAEVPGLLASVAALSADTGARLAWVPRRAGERGALDAGAAPTLLPGGRHVTDGTARAEVEAAWGLPAGSIPAEPGRSTDELLAAAADGSLAGLVVGGVDPDDLADPALAERALAKVGFLVSLELRTSAVTAHADVVLPVAAAVHRAGSYTNWEGRNRPFGTTIESTSALPDCRVLDTLAVEMDFDLHTATPAAAGVELASLGVAAGPVQAGGPAATVAQPAPGSEPAATVTPPGREQAVRATTVTSPEPGRGQAVLATWRTLLDNGSLQDNEPHLAATARPALALLNAATATALGVVFGEPVTVGTERGSVTIPAGEADLPDGVVWLPANSGPSTVRRNLGAGHGALVAVGPAAVGSAAVNTVGPVGANTAGPAGLNTVGPTAGNTNGGADR
jgi:NADH-quinone oxidoreductase subunit G